MFIELDRFTVQRKYIIIIIKGSGRTIFIIAVRPGQNNLVRRSDLSSITIPFERTFRDVDTNRPEGGDALAEFNYCGCGWPHHLLIPKGTTDGFPCDLFVMISNFADDRVSPFYKNSIKYDTVIKIY